MKQIYFLILFFIFFSAQSQVVFDPADGIKWMIMKPGTNLNMTQTDMGGGTYKYEVENTLTNNNQLSNGAGYATTSATVPKTTTITINGDAKDLSTNRSWTINSPGTDNAKSYSAGTVYTLTTTSQKVDFGTTDPVVTIPAPGTYLIFTNLKVEYAGLTTLLNTCNFKLRRTNNTASDIPNASTNFGVVATLLTGTGGDVDIAPVIYTTTNSNDVIELWGSRQTGISLTGQINVGEASIVAVRLY